MMFVGKVSLVERMLELHKQLPPPSLPQMPASTDFGGGEHQVEMKKFINTQVEVTPSPNPTSPSRIWGALGWG
jgi:hypothetical protein